MENNNPMIPTLTLLDQFILQIPKRFLVLTEIVLFGVSVTTVLDFTVRIVTAVITVTVGVWAVRAYKKRLIVDEIDIQIKSQQLARLIEEGKERDRIKKLTNDTNLN